MERIEPVKLDQVQSSVPSLNYFLQILGLSRRDTLFLPQYGNWLLNFIREEPQVSTQITW